MIILLHIPRTSGNSLESGVLKKNCPRFLSGHLQYGIHELLVGEEPEYITFLRDPSIRWRSLIRHALRKRRSRVYNKIKKIGVDGFISYCLSSGFLCNMMCRQIAGFQPNYYKPDYNPKRGRDDEWCYRRAKKNLGRFEFVGFTERANEDYHSLCRKMGWPFPEKITYRGRGINTTKMDMDKVAKINKYDHKLYDYARGLWW